MATRPRSELDPTGVRHRTSRRCSHPACSPRVVKVPPLQAQAPKSRPFSRRFSACSTRCARRTPPPSATSSSLTRSSSACARRPERRAGRSGPAAGSASARSWRPDQRARLDRARVVARGSRSRTLATVWAEYDFHFGQTPSHCGVDAVQLLKTPAGWKIVSIADTYEPTGCPRASRRVRPSDAAAAAREAD